MRDSRGKQLPLTRLSELLQADRGGGVRLRLLVRTSGHDLAVDQHRDGRRRMRVRGLRGGEKRKERKDGKGRKDSKARQEKTALRGLCTLCGLGAGMGHGRKV